MLISAWVTPGISLESTEAMLKAAGFPFHLSLPLSFGHFLLAFL